MGKDGPRDSYYGSMTVKCKFSAGSTYYCYLVLDPSLLSNDVPDSANHEIKISSVKSSYDISLEAIGEKDPNFDSGSGYTDATIIDLSKVDGKFKELTESTDKKIKDLENQVEILKAALEEKFANIEVACFVNDTLNQEIQINRRSA